MAPAGTAPARPRYQNRDEHVRSERRQAGVVAGKRAARSTARRAERTAARVLRDAAAASKRARTFVVISGASSDEPARSCTCAGDHPAVHLLRCGWEGMTQEEPQRAAGIASRRGYRCRTARSGSHRMLALAMAHRCARHAYRTSLQSFRRRSPRSPGRRARHKLMRLVDARLSPQSTQAAASGAYSLSNSLWK